MTWDYEVHESHGGFLQVVIGRPGGAMTDVTYVRGAATQVQSYTSGDPFGPATATLSFPSLTGYDDLDGRGGHGVSTWLCDYANVLIYWVPLTAGSEVVSPASNLPVAQGDYGNRSELWRGFVVSTDVTPNGITVQCQGALFQLDRYIQKPYYPPNPQAMEKLVAEAFDPRRRPALRTLPLQIQFPAGWNLKGKAEQGQSGPYEISGIQKNKNWTGYSSRSTGAWDRVLTGYVQDMLSVMYVPDEADVSVGNQWTVIPEANVPVLKVRDRYRTPDFELWYGTPGADITVTRDTSPVANVIYGNGTGFDGVEWKNAFINDEGDYTDYRPLAALAQVYPEPTKSIFNDNYDRSYWVNEQLYKYGPGFDLDAAIKSANKSLIRDMDPGWNGSLTLSTDTAALTRWQIKAGMTVRIKGIFGTGEAGMRFHIADVQHSPMQGTVEMKLDTRYRDLLNLEESQVRTRDPLTPAKMLQINRRSQMIEDMLQPWSYETGSGYVPRGSLNYFKQMAKDAPESYPWKNFIAGKADDGGFDNRPRINKECFVKVKAGAKDKKKRWGFTKVLMSQKGTCRLSQIAAFNADGTPALCDFHVSVYMYDGKLDKNTWQFMPRDDKGPSAFFEGAFESMDPSTGLPWANEGQADYHMPTAELIIGWGNKDQPAGYSPGRKSDGGNPTGMLYDESPWSWDFTNNPNFLTKAQKGITNKENFVNLTVAFYAEHDQDVYFVGRFYRQEPGGMG